MVTPSQAFAKYGDPEKERNMVLWDIPADLEIGVIPKRLYCNKDLVIPLTNAFRELITSGYVRELKTFDGCFNIRTQRGATVPSLHSWGIAFDVNAAWNQLKNTPVLTPGFVKCFTDNNFDWGGTFQRRDGMHFQLTKI